MRVLLVALLAAISYAQTEYIPHTIPPKNGYCYDLANKFNGACTETDNSFTLTNEAEGLHYNDYSSPGNAIDEAGMNRGITFKRNICLMALYGMSDGTVSKWGDLVDATYELGNAPSYNPMIGTILTERYLPRIHDHGNGSEDFIKKDTGTKMQTWSSVTCTWKARDYDLSNLVWTKCADYEDTSQFCQCIGGYARLKRTDSKYYYPLNIAADDSNTGVNLYCEESSFGVEGGMGESCECGIPQVCEDATEIFLEGCVDGTSDQWNFKIDCPSAQSGLDLSMRREIESWDDLISGINVGVNDEEEIHWQTVGRQKLDVSLKKGENDIYWRMKDAFKIKSVKLYDTDCTISFESLGGNDLMGWIKRFVNRVKDGNAVAIGIVAAAVLVPLFCCLMCCCCAAAGSRPKVVYRM